MGGTTSNCGRVHNFDGKFRTASSPNGVINGEREGNDENEIGTNGVRQMAEAVPVAERQMDARKAAISSDSTSAASVNDESRRRHSTPVCSNYRSAMSKSPVANDANERDMGEAGARVMRRIASTSAHRQKQRKNSPIGFSPSVSNAPFRQNPLVAASRRTTPSTGIGFCDQSPGRGSIYDCADVTTTMTTRGSNGVRIEAAADQTNDVIANSGRRRRCDTMTTTTAAAASGNSNESRLDTITGNCGVRFEPVSPSGFSAVTSATEVASESPSAASRIQHQQRRRSSIAFLPTYGGVGQPSSGTSSVFHPQSCGSSSGAGLGGGAALDRVNIGFGNATDLVVNFINAASGSSGGSRSPVKVEDNFWVPPTVWRKKRAQSLVPHKPSLDGGTCQLVDLISSAGNNNNSSSAPTSVQEMTIIESPPDSFDMTSSSLPASGTTTQGPDVSMLRRRRASMQDALDFTKINASLYERPMLANQSIFGQIHEENCGSLNLSVHYNADLSLLTVRLIRAQDLLPRDGQSGLDPYCRLRLLPDKKYQLHSKVHKRTACPEFDEDFIFDVSPTSLPERTLEVLIYDATPSAQPVNPAPVSDECVGRVLIPFDETNLHASTNTIWLWKGVAPHGKQTEVDKEPPGELMFSMSYLNSAARLTVVVSKARNLKPADETKTTANPFVRVELLHAGKRLKKKRTSTKRNTLNPTWNEALVFNLHGLWSGTPASQLGPTTLALPSGVQLEVTVLNDNLLGTNELLGRVLVDDQLNSGPGFAQWTELLAVRNAPARWRVLQRQQSCDM